MGGLQISNAQLSAADGKDIAECRPRSSHPTGGCRVVGQAKYAGIGSLVPAALATWLATSRALFPSTFLTVLIKLWRLPPTAIFCHRSNFQRGPVDRGTWVCRLALTCVICVHRMYHFALGWTFRWISLMICRF